MPMRKQYAIRVSLDESRLNTPVDLFDADSIFQIKREITARTFLLCSLAAVSLIWIFTHSFMSQGGILGILLFLIGYIWTVALTVGVTRDNRDGYQLYSPMYNYLFKDNRQVYSLPLSDEHRILPYLSDIKSFDKQRNYIRYDNGDYGQIFELSGNASMLSFDKDLSNTIDSAERFYNSIGNHVTLIYDTVSGPQRVVDQVYGKMDQIENLSPIFDEDIHQVDQNKRLNAVTVANNNIRNLLYAQREELENYIGRDFQSLRQYVTVRAINRDSLKHAVDWLGMQQSEAGDTYVKSVRMLDYDEIVAYLKSIYTTVDVDKQQRKS